MTNDPAASRRPGRSSRRRAVRGQSVVEFALIAPILLILVLAVIDVARIYTTSLSVESAAREAADYGAFGSQHWNDASYASVTLPAMQRRACVAARNLPDYVGADTSCTNPQMTVEFSGDKGGSWQSSPAGVNPACDDETRNPPCWVRVTLSYDFHLIVPLGIDVFSVHVGFPNTVTLVRSSVFATTDLSLPPSP
jgi:Flp pilus assembly protein TadG